MGNIQAYLLLNPRIRVALFSGPGTERSIPPHCTIAPRETQTEQAKHRIPRAKNWEMRIVT